MESRTSAADAERPASACASVSTAPTRTDAHTRRHPAVLDRLANFLPSLKTANEELAVQHAADPSSVNVEHVEDDTAQHIEMVS